MGWWQDFKKTAYNALAGPDVEPVAPITHDWGQANWNRDQSQDAAYRQKALANMLQAQAEGKGPSVAQEQLQQAQAQSVAQQASNAASAQGGAMNRAMANDQAANLAAQTSQQTAGQASTLRAQEQLGAMGQLGGVLGQTREGDIQAGTLAQNRQLGVGTQQVATNQQNIQAQISNREGQQQATNAIMGASTGIIGGIVKGGDSDRRVKHDVRPASREQMSALMEHLMPKEFKYNEEGDNGPTRLGIVAQDVERDPLGRNIITRDEDGIRSIDEGPALNLVLAAIGDLYSRLPKGGRHGSR